MNARADRKQATRARVLSAARDLFEEIGFPAATIRLIADRAGVATGSVFTTFQSKTEILRAVMEERVEALSLELERVRPHLRGTCCDQVRSIMAVHYSFEMQRPRLYTAYVATSFEWKAVGAPNVFGGNQGMRQMLRDILADGMVRGEVRADLDKELFLEMLLASYGFNYRYAGALDSTALIARMDDQVGLLFEGAKPRG